MAIPNDIDREALHLIHEAGLEWEDSSREFIETRDTKRESTEDYRSRKVKRVSHAQLRDLGLTGTDTKLDRSHGIERLKTFLGFTK